MVNIEILNNYIQELDCYTKSIIDDYVTTKGKDKTWELYLSYIDCTKFANNGTRVRQTIGYPYKADITAIIYLIETYFDNSDDKYVELIKVHNANLEFEKINPPIVYVNKRNTKQKINKETKAKKQKDRKEPSAAERKLAAKIGKINALSFKLKPIKHEDNTI